MDLSSAATGIETDLHPPTEKSALVRKLGSLCLISEEEIDFLEGLQNNTLVVDEGVDFIEDGQDRNTTFIVREGWAIRYIELANGRRQILGYALPGDILGLHINFNARATYSAAALTKLELAAVDPRRMLEVSQKYPIIASGLSWSTAREFAILGDQAVRLGRLSANRRLVHLFLELWHRFELLGGADGTWLDVPMTQRDLADTLGLSIVHVSRTIAELRKTGLLRIERHRVQLTKLDQLIEYAEFNTEHLAKFSV